MKVGDWVIMLEESPWWEAGEIGQVCGFKVSTEINFTKRDVRFYARHFRFRLATNQELQEGGFYEGR